MKIVVGADHAGFPLKQIVVEDLRGAGHEVNDVGTFHPELPDDYPNFATPVCEAVRSGKAERGVLVCGSAVGVTVAANKFPGIRAGTCHDHYSAHQGVEHDNMNVLCMGARIIGPEVAREIVETFIAAQFSREERHVRRLGEVEAIEQRFLKG
jgi:ribose 5-phosphate isomerase B